ncbi:MAG TPA: hypothetical protein VD997_08710 [Phycisphaerales bacterium]|nr:hypothetical protein [Phycisphaerales bacterium]
MKTAALMTATICSLLALSACEKKPATNQTTPPTKTSAAPAGAPAGALPGELFLTAAPADAKPVKQAKQSVKVGDTVAVVGRVGGSRKPFMEDRAVFTLMDPELPACSDNPDDGCKYPWDYCCEKKEDIAASAATIQVVDAAGIPLRVGLKGEHGLKELSRLTVVGKVTQLDGPTMVISATGIHIN